MHWNLLLFKRFPENLNMYNNKPPRLHLRFLCELHSRALFMSQIFLLLSFRIYMKIHLHKYE
jgi:hypothetical protein